MSQSSNDVIPSAIHISAALLVERSLIPGLKKLHKALKAKAKDFSDIIKSGRTHLQDATPVTLGQEFNGYAAQIEKGIERVEATLPRLHQLALGGTAVGTGLNTKASFAAKTIARIAESSNLPFLEAKDHFEAQGAQDAAVELSGQIRTVAVSLMKIANDIRWLGSGPRCGLGELQLPAIQPGSSIMPAKVNPVICESLMMICAQVIGNDATIVTCGQHGNLELNVMMPVLAFNLLESIEIIGTGSENFVDKCIEGLRADGEKCREYAESSLAICTSLAPIMGYDQAAKLAKQALEQDKTIRQLIKESSDLEQDKLLAALDLLAMTKPS